MLDETGQMLSCVYSSLYKRLKLTNTVDFLTGLTVEQTSVGKNQDHISTRHPSVCVW